jgi:glutamate---cysteine ligase / carboxylate-amine ligase
MPASLFSIFGVELEYMIVDARTHSVLPISDLLLRADSGEWASDSERGDLGWSNELVLHVIELKTKSPAPSLNGIASQAARDVGLLNAILAAHGGCLMPTAMHPWMDPRRETRLWPHDNSPVYQAFNRVFNCQGHGWSNLQSMHLNLPFANGEEFGRLHAAIRLVLPLLPALAASSPIQDGRPTGTLDNRLAAYRANCRRIPSITGRVIPEPVFTPEDYREQILQRMYREIAPFDPEGTLRDEWLNARGAIARFERDAIEIRLLDIQEAPLADLAIAKAVTTWLQAIVAERWVSYREQQTIATDILEPALNAAIREGGAAVIDNPQYLSALGFPGQSKLSLRDVWQSVLAQLSLMNPADKELDPLRIILTEGCLAQRILKATGPAPTRSRLEAVYSELCGCLAQNRLFQP